MVLIDENYTQGDKMNYREGGVDDRMETRQLRRLSGLMERIMSTHRQTIEMLTNIECN